jgi:hypothetical protein
MTYSNSRKKKLPLFEGSFFKLFMTPEPCCYLHIVATWTMLPLGNVPTWTMLLQDYVTILTTNAAVWTMLLPVPGCY